MKFKKIIVMGLVATFVSTCVLDMSTATVADAYEVSSETAEKATKYRFLQETRDEANQQGLDFVQASTKSSPSSISMPDKQDSSDDIEKAMKKYLQGLNEIAKENDKAQKKSARQELLDKLNTSDDQKDGVAFANPDTYAQQQAYLVKAINAMSNSMKKATKTVDKKAEEAATEEQQNNSAQSETNKSSETTIINTDDSSQTWTDADLAEIALCESTPNNVLDGTGNCNSTTRSYMAYTKVTSRTSAQYALLNSDDAYTDKDTGFRMYKGRYCIAIGQGYTKQIGTKIDLVLDDGSILKCVLGECKANRDTDAKTHTYCFRDGSVAEFIIDNQYFNTNTKHNPVNTALGKFGKIKKVVVINE